MRTRGGLLAVTVLFAFLLSGASGFSEERTTYYFDSGRKLILEKDLPVTISRYFPAEEIASILADYAQKMPDRINISKHDTFVRCALEDNALVMSLAVLEYDPKNFNRKTVFPNFLSTWTPELYMSILGQWYFKVVRKDMPYDLKSALLRNYNLEFIVTLKKSDDDFMAFFGTFDSNRIRARMQVPLVVKHPDYEIAEVYPIGNIHTGHGWQLSPPIDPVTGTKQVSYLAFEFLSADGSVAFDANPSKGKLYIDGEYMGTLPQYPKLREGFYNVKIALDGYEVFEKRMVVDFDGPINVTLTKLKHILKIESNPVGATAYLNDGKEEIMIGTSPLEYEIEPGSYALRLEKSDFLEYKPDSRKIEFGINDAIRLFNFTLQPKCAYLSVVKDTENAPDIGLRISGRQMDTLPLKNIQVPIGDVELKIGSYSFQYILEENASYSIDIFPALNLYDTAEDLKGYNPTPKKPNLIDEWIYRKEINALPESTASDIVIGTTVGAAVGLAGGAIASIFVADESDQLLIFGVSSVSSAAIGCGIAFVVNLASAPTTAVKDRLDESKVQENAEKFAQWETEKKEVERHNEELLRKENRKIEEQNRDRNKAEIKNVETGKIDVIVLN